MTNAKEEFLSVFGMKIKCACIIHCPEYDTTEIINLLVNHTEEDMRIFLNNLDFEYYAGVGTQHVFGTVWIDDTTWAERCEYNGSENWEVYIYPEIPRSFRLPK